MDLRWDKEADGNEELPQRRCPALLSASAAANAKIDLSPDNSCYESPQRHQLLNPCHLRPDKIRI